MISSASSQRFDTIAAHYASSEIHATGPTIAKLHHYLGNPRFASVCDIACGAGYFGLSFAGKAARIVGVDPAH